MSGESGSRLYDKTANEAAKKVSVEKFFIIAAIFFVFYSGYYLWRGDRFFSWLYLMVLVAIVIEQYVFRHWHNDTVARFFLVALGLPVLLPWQVNGGVAGTGIFWYYIYVIWIFSLLGRSRGLVWIIAAAGMSLAELGLQLAGYLPRWYSSVAMMSFYFGLLLQSAVSYIFQTAVERNEQLVYELRAKDRAILSGIGDGVFVVDPKGKLVLFNKVAQELSGFSEREALGRYYRDVLRFFMEGDGKRKHGDNFIAKALLGRRVSMANHTLLMTKHGGSIPVADSAAPVWDAMGNVQGVVVVFRDVSRERELERLKDDFVSTASHELRTPLSAIRVFSSMILGGTYGSIQPELLTPLTTVQNAALRLAELVDDMLDVAQIEAGRMKFEIKDVIALDSITEVIDTLAPLAAEKGINLKTTRPKKTVIQADPHKLEQVLTNLVGNALKFTHSGTVTIGTLIDKNMLEISVRDTGIGITAEDQARLFGKFERLRSTGKTSQPGTGLGLYISREIIRKMGGELWIKNSTPGKGTTFAFTIPRTNTSSADKAGRSLSRAGSLLRA